MTVLLAAAGWAAVGASSPPRIQATASVEAPSTDGTFTLEWSAPSEALAGQYEVELDRTGTGDAYEPWYTGPAQRSFVSGLRSGEVTARVRAAGSDGRWSPWSAPVRVRVAHHSFLRALSLLAVGAFVFAAIGGYVLFMSRRERSA